MALSQLFPYMTSPLGLVLTVSGSIIVLYLIEHYILGVPYPPEVSLVREPAGARRFSIRMRLSYYTDCQNLFRDAYDNYLKKGKPVVIPGIGFRHEVLMPPQTMSWVMAQPENELDPAAAFVEIDQVRWALGDDRYVSDAWHGMLVKTDLNRVLENICTALNSELGVAFDKHFGTDTENWKEIDLFETTGRNEEYLRLSLEIVDRLVLNAGVTGGAPRLLQPLVGTTVNWTLHSKVHRLKTLFAPIWKERLVSLKRARDDLNHVEPQDHLQMMLRFAEKHRPEEFNDLDSMTRRLIATNFGSMHQTNIQVTNLLLNIIGSAAEFNTIAILRDETRRFLQNGSDTQWTKAKVAQMVKSDSVLRETLRLQSFGGRAVLRKVMVEGYKTPSGYSLPKGTIISFLGQAAQTDADSIEDPLKFDPFRFSRLRDEAANKNEPPPPVSFVATGPEYLSFGHGKHACPGRFLIDFELKMIIAYVLGHYDIEFPSDYNNQRPANYWVAEAVFPPKGARLMIKRRPTEA
ncbi:cytochrome P450 [Ilyonectria sp. MPI-CAGE-AT-0026]|nr:cytochrome P450 [Ilyonectria sp. MPI-CAGE-AT-0026]